MSKENVDYNKFPYKLTDFIKKVDARYDGDPLGDFVMAEDMNSVQRAISKIEEAIGIRVDTTKTIEDRIDYLTKFEPIQVPEVGYFDSLPSQNIQYTKEITKKYEYLILNERTSIVSELVKTNKVYGRVLTQGFSLEEIQSTILAWRQAGVSGIFLDNLERPLRTEESYILESVVESGLELIVSGDIIKLLTKQVNPYNPSGLKLYFPDDTVFAIKDFGYTGETIPLDVVMSNLLPLVRLIKDNNYKIIGFSDARSQKDYNMIHTLALLLSVDFMYYGAPQGSQIDNLPHSHNWPLMMSIWRDKSPNVFLVDDYLERHLLNGSIILKENGEVKFKGLQETSSMVEWEEETIPGESIRTASISPDKLSTYDIEKIIRLINSSPESLRIVPQKIESDGSDYFLPGSIGASYLEQNVIEAINKKNNKDSLEFSLIENTSIKTIKANQIIGSIQKEQLIENIIESINETSTSYSGNNYPDIIYADIDNLYGSGQLEYSRAIIDWATMTSADVQEELTTNSINNEGLITSISGKFEELDVGSLKADNLVPMITESINQMVENGGFDFISKGEDGKDIEYAWQETSLGVRKEGEEDYSFVDLKGPEGKKGERGNSLEFNWDGSKLGVKQETDEEYTYIDLKGDTGDISSLSASHIEDALGYLPISINDVPEQAIPDWENIENKPMTFAPSAHEHEWDSILSKPSVFSPDKHIHQISEIEGLQDELDGVPELTKENIGLSNVDNIQQASKAEFDLHTNDGKSHISQGDAPPPNPKEGWLWLDTSVPIG